MRLIDSGDIERKEELIDKTLDIFDGTSGGGGRSQKKKHEKGMAGKEAVEGSALGPIRSIFKIFKKRHGDTATGKVLRWVVLSVVVLFSITALFLLFVSVFALFRKHIPYAFIPWIYLLCNVAASLIVAAVFLWISKIHR